jgi:aspartate kinase
LTIVVQKYGGSSVADAARLRHVAGRIARVADAGHQVVVTVSAMGDTTDDLIALAASVSAKPSRREMDVLLSTGEMASSALLAMALKEMGYAAISLNGVQAGLRTDTNYGRARIAKINSKRIRQELDKGKIVVVAGFQGLHPKQDIATLGRGGSDTTAVALAISLKAAVCEIYTDVEGVYSADPRLIPEAFKLDEIHYDEMLEMATYGARVMHPRAVELGEYYEMPIRVASSFVDRPGTLIHGRMSMEMRNKARSIASDLDVAKVTVVGVPDQPGIAASIFSMLAEAGVSVDTIVQNASIGGSTDLTFTVHKNDRDRALEVIRPVGDQIGAREIQSDDRLGKVSVIGTGMLNTPGYAARMFRALSDKGINIELISTSEIRITCLIEKSTVKDAVRVLHRTFELEPDTDNA